MQRLTIPVINTVEPVTGFRAWYVTNLPATDGLALGSPHRQLTPLWLPGEPYRARCDCFYPSLFDPSPLKSHMLIPNLSGEGSCGIHAYTSPHASAWVSDRAVILERHQHDVSRGLRWYAQYGPPHWRLRIIGAVSMWGLVASWEAEERCVSEFAYPRAFCYSESVRSDAEIIGGVEGLVSCDECVRAQRAAVEIVAEAFGVPAMLKVEAAALWNP